MPQTCEECGKDYVIDINYLTLFLFILPITFLGNILGDLAGGSFVIKSAFSGIGFAIGYLFSMKVRGIKEWKKEF